MYGISNLPPLQLHHHVLRAVVVDLDLLRAVQTQ